MYRYLIHNLTTLGKFLNAIDNGIQRQYEKVGLDTDAPNFLGLLEDKLHLIFPAKMFNVQETTLICKEYYGD